MRTILTQRVFLLCTTVTVLFLLFMVTNETWKPLTGLAYHETLTRNVSSVNANVKVLSAGAEVNQTDRKPDMKYILQWTSRRDVPFVYMGVGQEGFTSRNCPYTNCIVTSDRNYLGSITKFDVIAFAGPQTVKVSDESLPKVRSIHQKYVFATIESSHYYPVCSNRFDGFFNWTWSFRLDSDVRWGYMAIRDSKNIIVGPNKVMHWIKLDDMEPVTEGFRKKLKTKNTAAAWFVSNCYDKSGRMAFALQLKRALGKYNLILDIYGTCGTLSCSSQKQEECYKLLENKYYFYLSFENSFSEDYVTEKLLHALRNNVVPVVYGGANYTRFMPDGIYLNARELGVEKLAKKMSMLISDEKQYADFFRWQKYYSYHGLYESTETSEYCRFCEILNNRQKVESSSIIQNFREWWDNPEFC